MSRCGERTAAAFRAVGCAGRRGHAHGIRRSGSAKSPRAASGRAPRPFLLYVMVNCGKRVRRAWRVCPGRPPSTSCRHQPGTRRCAIVELIIRSAACRWCRCTCRRAARLLQRRPERATRRPTAPRSSSHPSYAPAFYGAIRMAPSRRIVSPFTCVLDDLQGELGVLLGSPSRDGNGTCAPRLFCASGRQAHHYGVRKRPGAMFRRGAEAREIAAMGSSPTTPPLEAE